MLFPLRLISAVRSLDRLHAAYVQELAADLPQLFHARDFKTYGQGRDPVLAGHCINFQNIDISLRKVSGDIIEKACPVIGIDDDLAYESGFFLIFCSFDPGSLYDPPFVFLIQIVHIDAVSSVDRDASASRDKTYDLVTGNRIAALGKADRHIMDSFDDNGALRLRD